MADIKTREVVRGTIKTIDKTIAASDRMKSAAIRTKRGAEELYQSSEGSPDSYAQAKISYTAKRVTSAAGTKAEAIGRAAAESTKKNLLTLRENSRIANVNEIRREGSRVANSNRANASAAMGQSAKSGLSTGGKLMKSRYINKEGERALALKMKLGEAGAKRKEQQVAAFLKSVRRIMEDTKTLVTALTAAGWVSVVMIFVTIFIAGTINLVDIVSVDPDQPGMNDRDRQIAEEVAAEYPNGYIGPGDGNIVNVALSQVGNVGGRRYWYWYGFSSRVEWCCCFVSWCANQCGYIKAGIIPKFAATGQGVNFFKKQGVWHGRSYRPRAGDIIFFTWEPGVISHVGIVKSCDGKRIYTIEGNSGDRCREKNYAVGAACIYGIASPKYDAAK